MMTDEQGERLSALMDGEVDELELRRLLGSMNRAEHQRWARWHLAEDVLQGRIETIKANADFSKRVCEAVDDTSMDKRSGWYASLSRVAVAAAVALAVVSGWQVWQWQSATTISDGVDPVASTQHSAQPFNARIQQAQPVGLQTQPLTVHRDAQPVADTFTTQDNDLRYLLRRHSRAAAQQGEQGMMPYVRMIDFDSRGNP